MKSQHIPAAAALAEASIAGLTGTASAAGPTCADGVIKVGAVSTVTGAGFDEVQRQRRPPSTRSLLRRRRSTAARSNARSPARRQADPSVLAQAARDLIDNQEES